MLFILSVCGLNLCLYVLLCVCTMWKKFLENNLEKGETDYRSQTGRAGERQRGVSPGLPTYVGGA